ncbi:enoyl-CoA hydratase/isomerase family protein [Nocardioides mangrovicus]|uniref:Enoyl-CoA hydratase/isomerase family protein n=1 Tax=Nocardioides mangrovicus TaxID=2478913 RepID=A0A3L8NX14_9ACTN|nr:enoyl-CoA hydratase-related protein [Nocardioides mangrovicus]RLV47464.1 enoyl-CoA hydratase/isomerase family protein [Nocardioides mangrovicus]
MNLYNLTMITKSKTYETLAVSRDDDVAWVRFDRPEHRNTVTAQMAEEMYAALGALADDDRLRLVVLTGQGRDFCPGADLDREPGEPAQVPAAEAFESAALLAEMPQLTIAAVNGGCAGAGFSWAMACDLRVAVDRARFATAFLDVGVAGELGLAWMLTRHLGSARARDLLLLPGKLTAADLLDLGLVSRVYTESSWDADVAELVAGLVARNPRALRDIKANLLDAERLSLREYLEVETARHLAQFEGSAAETTFAAFASRNESLKTSAVRRSFGSPS